MDFLLPVVAPSVLLVSHLGLRVWGWTVLYRVFIGLHRFLQIVLGCCWFYNHVDLRPLIISGGLGSIV